MKIGPTFEAELERAGLRGLRFSWGEDGVFYAPDALTDEQQATLAAVVEAHDPSALPPEPQSLTPDEKLRAFFASNPDVRAYVFGA